MPTLAQHVRVPWTRPADQADPARELDFYLGTHEPSWLNYSPVPLFVSFRRMIRYTDDPDLTRDNLPMPKCRWALDSGGFTELKDYGDWQWSPDEYGSKVVDLMLRAGTPPTFVAAQDWMCEDVVIRGGDTRDGHFVGTGLSVIEHQERTVENYVYLAEQFPMVPWLPTLQGQTIEDYMRCADMYAAAGVDLAGMWRVGLGSVCRREATSEIAEIVFALADLGLRLHGFGVKRGGFALYGRKLTSADSLAWSEWERWRKPWDVLAQQQRRGCTHRAEKCQNCLVAALEWRDDSLEALRRQAPMQGALDLAAVARTTSRRTAAPARPAAAAAADQLALAV